MCMTSKENAQSMKESETFEQTVHRQEQNMHCCAEGLALQCLSFNIGIAHHFNMISTSDTVETGHIHRLWTQVLEYVGH